ncbi:TonB-dependent receptor [Erythrobacter arachoides]|uniref:TonB-dependent receptor n=1 Tax=Aurantiacibacter arachoides TaxID=1850444 RepID=A0A845A1V5_9SPHN|nr:TonB-dependent receptor [Aurantiacibacter arachoides]MXO93432.1 TonB-dependent receptor [Aurantiacibacter arachoides]GGD49451.1 TonB-dependent receptor [Aurantiacibacter arachoides]
MFNRKTKSALLASSVISVSLFAAPAMAQDVGDNDPSITSAQEAGPIVVTGSRIQRRNTDTAAPVAVVDDAEFELSGTVNVENVVNQLPQVVPGLTAASNNPGNGTATLNLRGLGATRSLVLVNGRRWMFFDTSQLVDLNTIPSFLIESVDVVTGGASAVYGSDALAGVVNFRLRHVDGVEVGAQYSITDRGDADRYEIHGALGTDFADGRGKATVFGEYYSRDPLFQGDRAFSNFALGGESFGEPLQQFGSSTMPALRFNAPGSTVVNGTTFALGSGLVIDDAIFDVGSGAARARAGDTYNYAPVNYLQIPQERYLLGGYAEYEITDWAVPYAEVAFVNNRVATELAATPVTGTFDVNLAAVQPFVSTAVFQQLQTLDARETAANAARIAAGLSPLAGAAPGTVSASLQRRVIETGSRNSLDERNAFRVLAGLRGDITDYLQYDAYYTYNRTRNANIQAGNISRSAFQNALNGTTSGINIFDEGGLTQEQVDQISILAQNSDVSTLEVASAAISGTLGDFALGQAEPIGFALGGEYRRVASQFIPDTALASGDVIGFNAGDPTEGSYNVKEVFGEISVPVEFGSARLELTGAARYSDYSLEAVGGVFTYAGGVEFAPIPDITFRGQYQRAVRAPNVAELFQGTAIGFPGATDPCGRPAAASPGALRDLCLANGVPAANLGNAAIIQPNAQIPALFGGNPNLQEETSDSYTFGVVIQPLAIPGLTVTADYFNIKIEDAISTISLQQSFDLCFDQFQDAGNPLCGPFFGFGDIRGPEGAIDVDSTPVLGAQNIAEFVVSGIDLQVSYNMDLDFSLLGNGGSDLNLNFLGTWTEESSFLATPDSDLLDCAGVFGTACGQPTPTFKWTARATYVDGPLTFSTRWRHLSAVDDDDDTVDYGDFNGTERIPAYDLVDLTLGYDFRENVTFTVGVNNVFDTLPMTPTFDGIIVSNTNNGTLLGDNQEQANTYPSVYDTLGRDFFASVLFRF